MLGFKEDYKVDFFLSRNFSSGSLLSKMVGSTGVSFNKIEGTTYLERPLRAVD